MHVHTLKRKKCDYWAILKLLYQIKQIVLLETLDKMREPLMPLGCFDVSWCDLFSSALLWAFCPCHSSGPGYLECCFLPLYLVFQCLFVSLFTRLHRNTEALWLFVIVLCTISQESGYWCCLADTNIDKSSNLENLYSKLAHLSFASEFLV